MLFAYLNGHELLQIIDMCGINIILGKQSDLVTFIRKYQRYIFSNV